MELTLVRKGAPPAARPEPPAASPYGSLPRRRPGPETEPAASAEGDSGSSCPCPIAGTCRCRTGIATVRGATIRTSAATGGIRINQNKLKGDYPVFGKRTFFNFTGVSDTLLEGRNLPVAERRQHRAAAAASSSSAAAASTCRSRRSRTSFDLFRGDTVFRPDRLARPLRAGLQRATSSTCRSTTASTPTCAARTRASITTSACRSSSSRRSSSTSAITTTSCRSAPASRSSRRTSAASWRCSKRPASACSARCESSRIEYNAAVFDMLEKDTNSGFNEMNRRHQQIYIANVYVQDFLTPGYTAVVQLPRQRRSRRAALRHERVPGAAGADRRHRHQRGRRPYYLGEVGQRPPRPLEREPRVLPGARPREQQPDRRAAASTSTRRWARWSCRSTRTGCGSRGPRSSPRATAIRPTTRGTASTRSSTSRSFAGGPFSLWNRQGLRLAQTGTGLKSPVSLLPTLRTNKDEGQPNFVNPGIFILNARGRRRADAEAARLRHHQLRPLPEDRADGSAALPGEGRGRTSASTSAAAPATARRSATTS